MYIIFTIKLTIWLTIVAIAAPLTPILKVKIAIGSNIILIIAPITIDTIEYFGDPSALIIEFSVVPIII